MVGARTRPQPVRGYRLASALMTFLLVGVLVLDFGRGFTSKSMAPAAPREVMMEEMSDAAADALEEPALLEAESAMEADRAADEIEAEAPAEETLSPAVAAEVSEGEESVGLAEEVQTKSTGAADPDTAANQADEWQEDEVVEELIIPSQEIAPKIPGTGVPESPPAGALPEEELLPVERKPIIDPFRMLEIILGLGALIFGAAAWLSRRKT